MTLRYVIAALHLIALAIGFASIIARAQALRTLTKGGELRTLLVADAMWGIAALLWLGTGLWRAFGGLEKGTAYYLSHPLFHAKMGLFILIVVLELKPAVTLGKWRGQARRGETVDTGSAHRLSQISVIESAIVLLIVFLAAAIARGMGV